MKINSIITYENVFICNVSKEGVSERTVESLPLDFPTKGASEGTVGSLDKGASEGTVGSLDYAS